MKNIKTNKGITLIALIITIAVLLILAGVAVSGIEDEGIIKHAINARDDFNRVQREEEEMLNNYLIYLKQSQCNHTFVDGVCTGCGYKIEDSGDGEIGGGTEDGEDGVELCPPHVWNSSTGKCQICGNQCNHPVYNSATGECTTCKMLCFHNWNTETGKCKICKMLCSHNWNMETGECTTCKMLCSHNWNAETGKCKTCGIQCNHPGYDWQTKKCTICEMTCPHKSWSTLGSCNDCGTYCNHPAYDHETHKCTICGVNCTHRYADGICKDCGDVCKHSWSSKTGECYKCDMICSHTYSSKTGNCTNCGFECVHDWKLGNCMVCKLKCSHTWSSGECTTCGMICSHNTSISEYRYQSSEFHEVLYSSCDCGKEERPSEIQEHDLVNGICVCYPQECKEGNHNCTGMDANARCNYCGAAVHKNENGDPWCDLCGTQVW